jgi:IMP cyclohydrolase
MFMSLKDISQLLQNNSYPGRGIIIGKSESGSDAVIAYFIMGRSENSRNRIFVAQAENGGIKTEAYDPAKLTDPSLVIYSPVRVYQNAVIVTNGDQTDTIFEHLTAGKTFEQALRTRAFEPDAPNFTPRISGIVEQTENNFSYKLSILKSNRTNSASCLRFFFEYAVPVNGEGHFIHTYEHDGSPIPSFEGEPTAIAINGDIDTFANTVWQSLNNDNKVSLFVRYVNLKSGIAQSRIMNKNM